MKKTLVIIKREYLTRVRTRAFALGTIATPLLLVGLVLLPGFFIAQGGGERQAVVLDQSGEPALYETIKEKVEELAQDQNGAARRQATRFVLSREVVPPDEDIDEFRRFYNREVAQEDNSAYIVLRRGILDGAAPEYYSKNVSDPAIRDIERAIGEAVIEHRLKRAGYDPQQVNNYLEPVEVNTIKVGSEGESEEEGAQVFYVAFTMLIFLYGTVLAYGMTVMRGVIEEKQSRIVELIISSVKPFELLMGKLIGIGLVGLTQYTAWTLAVALLSAFGSAVFATSGVTFPQIRVSLLAYFVAYFVLGYFLYATLYAIVGAMVSSEEDAQQVQFPVMMLIILPMLLFGIVIDDPNSPASILLSLTPFFASMLMMLRIAVAPPPFWQIALSMALLAATILGAIWVAARIYRVGILMYGKRPSLTELGRWLRYS
ncbi:MAG TPA: ABC transporter permease [Blastocatellia bacterium]|nr:ABC transporter permease [Blastocatellia bacterium]